MPALAFDIAGHFVQGGFAIGHTVPGGKIYLENQLVPVGPDGLFVIGFGRDNATQVTVNEILGEDNTQTHVLAVQQRLYQVQRYDNVPPVYASPAADITGSVQAQSQALMQARNAFTDIRDFQGGFRWPVTGPVVATYGTQLVLNGQPQQPDYGVELAVPVGTPVVAPAGGVVRYVGSDRYLSGGTLLIDHGYGLTSTIFHLGDIGVRVGDRVSPGTMIGHVGANPLTANPTLHWGMSWLSVPLDPALATQPGVPPAVGTVTLPTSP
ncbi:MAG TPA: M23 family metallopeptidase [Dongiaceae bacterium]|jgi:murein DD-endopeptidase MepM/ murein hydrolase activator NlpD|nr:M23 family metallopeptidase [Dongiaceae bacterium]